MRPWCSTNERIPSSTSSTRAAPAPPFRRSCSSRWPATGSRAGLRQSDLFSQLLIANYLFDRDKIYAYVNLDDNELFIYQRLYDLIAPDVPPPDLVIYLQTPVEVVRRRLRERAKADPAVPLPAPDYIRELNEAYNHFFFHYTASPLLTVETSHVDLTWKDETVADIERQIRSMGKGTRYYVPRTQ